MIADAVWREWIPEALADGRLQAKPNPLIIGNGLSDMQKALEKHKKGVSAAKVVVKL